VTFIALPARDGKAGRPVKAAPRHWKPEKPDQDRI
jgi:hypothetical protein